jgi:gentisate 1,2-dioxygenase
MSGANIQALWAQPPSLVPSWCAVDHEAAGHSELFVLSDAPVLEALGLGRTEVLEEAQDATGAWSGG